MEMDVAFGPIADLISDSSIEEIWINSPQRVFIARAGKSELTNLLLTADYLYGVAGALIYLIHLLMHDFPMAADSM
jgi:Flp pilus assembly CpaF family ATPase